MLAAIPPWLLTAAQGLSWLMQFSILVPMVVLWRRRAQFPPALRRLSWYVYLSLLSVVLARAAEFMRQPNLLIISGFNLGKILLFASAYALVLQQPIVRQVLLWLSVLGVLFGLGSLFWQDAMFLLTFSRTLQCALLAAFALAYLEQLSREPPAEPLRRNPWFLVSVGQLLYSAGTVIFFSFGLTTLTYQQHQLYFSIVAISGLFFNLMLTLAFLRAEPESAPRPVRPGNLP